jgi:hypothetical protein
MRSSLRVNSIAVVAAALVAAAGSSDGFASSKTASALTGKKGDPTPTRPSHRPKQQQPAGSKKVAKHKTSERRTRRPRQP